MRIPQLALLFGCVGLAACDSSRIPSEPAAVLRPFDKYASTEGSGSIDETKPYQCPTNFIAYAVIPGNIYPYHTTGVGSRLVPLDFSRVVGYSNTGIPIGKYIIPPGPWTSDDGKIAIVSGNVTGYCLYTPIARKGVWNFTGSLQVTDFDGEIINIPGDGGDECDGGGDADGDGKPDEYETIRASVVILDVNDSTSVAQLKHTTTRANVCSDGDGDGDPEDEGGGEVELACWDEYIVIELSPDGENWYAWWEGWAKVCDVAE